MRALSGTGPAGDFFRAELLVWAPVDNDRASVHNHTAKSRVNPRFGISFNIRFLRESGGIFAHSREKNKVERRRGKRTVFIVRLSSFPSGALVVKNDDA
jgi:hypothetical protein